MTLAINEKQIADLASTLTTLQDIALRQRTRLTMQENQYIQLTQVATEEKRELQLAQREIRILKKDLEDLKVSASRVEYIASACGGAAMGLLIGGLCAATAPVLTSAAVLGGAVGIGTTAIVRNCRKK
jgi:hypothetical protein